MIIYKKFDQYDQEKKKLLKEIRDFLKIDLDDLHLYHIYILKNKNQVETIKDELFDLRTGTFIEELPEDLVLIKDHDGQYNQVEDLSNKYIENILDIDNEIRYVKGYDFGKISQDKLETIKSYLINGVVESEVSLEDMSFDFEKSDDSDHRFIEGFIDFDDRELKNFTSDFGLDFDDMKFIQSYFKKEGRNPRYSELKMLDTYWSDHCRHTTFLTNLEEIKVEEGKYKKPIEDSLKEYKKARDYVYTDQKKPVSLMDLATINSRILKKKGLLDDLEKSNEVNACSVEVDIEVDGKKEKWLHMFKNETHNHPTEIEPYGGAHTCIGGGIRDPLSGRAQVIQGIRIIGAGNPKESYEDRLEGKLAQRYICQNAMLGFSDYANQIGAPVGMIREFYDPGFVAKRMELGALVAAVPKDYVKREDAKPGDVILLLGAPTGRDGLGAAVGSSSVQTKKSLTKAGAEVQKGNPFEERKIIRLFNRKEATRLIKKSNDFGAGGVSVAIGELADGLDIYLDEVYTKYPGLNGYEIALSESQERMAVVLDPRDLDEFIGYCQEEDVKYAKVAVVNDENRLRMHWKDQLIIDLSRRLLDSNGAEKFMDVLIESEPKKVSLDESYRKLNEANSRNLSRYFDSSLGRNKVFEEFGGKNRTVQADGIVTKFPRENTKAASIMTYGYHPEIGRISPYHAGYYGVINSITSNIAMTGQYKNIRLSMQEFFPSIKADKKRMAYPFAALLGAFKVMKDLNLAAIGGKDSMSGSYQDIDVPPSLISFAVSVGNMDKLVSRELKKSGSYIYVTDIKLDENKLVDLASFREVMDAYGDLLDQGKVLAASLIRPQGLAYTLEDMGSGNDIGFEVVDISGYEYGNIVFESREKIEDDHFIEVGRTKRKKYQIEPSLLNDVYPDIRHINEVKGFAYGKRDLEEIKLDNPRVLIPVIDGATGEYDLQRAMEVAGFKVDQFVIRTNSHDLFVKSLEEFARKISKSSVVAIGHGDYYASVIKNQAGLMTKVVTAEGVKKALENLLDRKGFLIGIGAGMQVLIDGGYFGPIEDDLFFVENDNQAYLNEFVDVRPVTNSYVNQDEEYTSIISSRRARLVCKDLDKIKKYLDILAVKEKTILKDDCPIDSISSKDGHVIGIASLIERMSKDLYRNIEIKGLPKHFERLRENFN